MIMNQENSNPLTHRADAAGESSGSWQGYFISPVLSDFFELPRGKAETILLHKAIAVHEKLDAIGGVQLFFN